MATEKRVDSMDWYWNPDPKEEAEEDARDAAYTPKADALVQEVVAGRMTEDECVAALLQLQKDLGYKTEYSKYYTPKQHEFSTRSWMRHVLHGDK
jgi:hypothetical protein